MLAFVLAALAASVPADAQPLGSAFTYQGQLKESGVAASGLYDLQMCLYSSPTSTIVLACAPDFADVPVDAGLFTVAADFGAAVFGGQQRWLELGVRAGASSGAYATLLPRQLLRAVPEALRANAASTAPWTGLSGVPVGFADGLDNDSGGTLTQVSAGAGLSGGSITTIGTLAIANGGVTATMIASGAVGAAQIASNAVDAARIVDDSVGAAEIGANAVGASELASNAVDTAAIVDANVTAAKIAPGAVGAAQINSAQVQARVTGSCADGEYFRGIEADGSLICELLPVAFNRVPDSSASAGSFVALALRVDQRPVIAYYDATNGNLKLYDCADASCASGTRRILDSSGDVGTHVALAIRPNGLPVVAYRSVTGATLKLYDCSNVACSAGTARTLDSGVSVGPAVAMALRADGRPILAYRDDSFFRLRVYECDNLACSSGAAFAHPGSGGPPDGVAIAMRGDGRPLIALGGNAGAGTRVRVYDCADTGCTSGTLRNLTDLSSSSSVAIAIRSNALPLVATAGIASNLGVHDCTDAACAVSTRVSFASNTTNPVGMALRGDGRALIVHGIRIAAGTSDLRVLDCANSACAAGSSRSLVGAGDFGTAAAMALRADGRPLVAYHDAIDDDLRLHICANPDCS